MRGLRVGRIMLRGWKLGFFGLFRIRFEGWVGSVVGDSELSCGEMVVVMVWMIRFRLQLWLGESYVICDSSPAE